MLSPECKLQVKIGGDSALMTKPTVAIFVFNRPRETRALLDRLRVLGIESILVVGDGPRPGSTNDKVECDEVRNLVNGITWANSVRSNFAEVNLGLEKRFTTGLSWVFSQVEEAIVLEDDCLPTRSFFSFAEHFLTVYKDDPTVGMIQGWTPLTGRFVPEGYFKSTRPKVWGWATWADVAKSFDGAIPELSKEAIVRRLLAVDYSRAQARRFARNLLRASEIGTWDYQWVWHLLSNNLKSISPTRNLVQNVGFGQNATHTKHSLGYFDKPAENVEDTILSCSLVRWSKVLDRAEALFVVLGTLRRAFSSPGQSLRPFLHLVQVRLRTLK